ncbi:DUF456 domain-containing protein [Aureliella helgolandensis]|uniref:DUF456 domain-containing protein n=1 Tax=Aureliella helgolandensis TaxID=2527968 RepID=A0A518GFP4_9BACT|nr:DUF456 domain-containing protein [Aureliella helgolandensis]QDV27413.1 hypothetical protein Q31a_58020 [Aureliella helgolandensis]
MFLFSLMVLLTLLAIVAWAIGGLGMPGNWGIVLMALACWFFFPQEYRGYVGLLALLGIVAAALLGELLEFAASALGASRLGGSKRGAALALVGSLAGAVGGLFLGALVPPPILGSVLVSLLLGASGSFVGAAAGERWAGKDWESSLNIGSAAFWGRLLGTVGKALCGTIACGLFLIALWW